MAVPTETSAGSHTTTPPSEFIRGIGPLAAISLVVGSMIGSGIFIVPADMGRQIGPWGPGALLLVWVITGAMTVTGALAYAELAAMMPRAGGQYVFLREGLSPLAGFLYGWTLFAVIQTGTIAAVAVAFAKYSGVFVPWISAQNYLVGSGQYGITTQRLLAIAVTVLLTFVNRRGIRTGAVVQNVFTFAKTAALLGLVGLGFAVGRNPEAVAANFTNFWRHTGDFMTVVRLVGVAMVGSLFSSDAWNNVTFTAGEVRNPRRNLPLSLALGVGIVSALYIACNFVYLNVLPLAAIQQVPEDRVATAVVARMLGSSAVQVMAVAIMISTFGCANGLILSGARVYYAMALDGLFFKRAGELDPRFHTPAFALVIQCVWACLLTLSGSYGDLLDYVIFAVLLFYILTIAGIFVLRRTRPDMDRPYRAFGYPVLPALYIAVASVIEILLLIYKPSFTFPGLGIVLLGVPVYFLWRRKA
jgi:basic amino acid/polyamine antiporter, APA family